jgi:hypothetical protein
MALLLSPDFAGASLLTPPKFSKSNFREKPRFEKVTRAEITKGRLSRSVLLENQRAAHSGNGRGIAIVNPPEGRNL